jgi:hypothetical protein
MPVELGSFSFGFVAGGAVVGIINHLLAGVRDKQARHSKDFNEVAEALADMLRKEREYPSPGSEIDFFAFRRVLSQRELSRFDARVKEYENTKNNCAIALRDENSIYVRISDSYQDATPVIKAIDELMKFTDRK